MGQNISNSLIEENECYDNYRHCFVLFGGSANNEVRRNYANSRGYWNFGSGYCGGCKDTAGFMNYGGQSNIFENNISEGEPEGHNNEPVTGGAIAQNNTFLGEISLNDDSCFRSSVHSANDNSRNINWSNSVCITPTNNGLWSRSSTNTRFDHLSIFGSSSRPNGGGVTCDKDASGGTPPFTCYGNSVAITGMSAGTAFLLAGGATGTIDYLPSFGNASIGGPTITHLITVNPSFGSCYLWVPAASPLKGAGSDGTDLGRRVIFRYEGGGLTAEPLSGYDHWGATF